ncbi:hypothetical protein ACFY1B_45045 [Streptomyces mirabilis]|uniref:hypothetical protein n=1 Tax=Streptomyces mirabilis TaxID=68239 RepID=UPI00369A9EDF
MTDPVVLERIATPRAELDGLEEQLAKQLEEVHAERDELAVAERVPERPSEKVATAQASTAPVSAQVGGRGALSVPHRAADVDQRALPPEYQRILAVAQHAAGPVMTRQVGEPFGLTPGGAGHPGAAARVADQAGRPRLAAAGCGWLRKLPDGKFTARL